MRDLHLGIDITGNNRDFLRAIGGSVAAMRALDGEQRRVATSTRGVEQRTRSLNRELNNSNVHLRAYARNLGTINGLQRSVFAPFILSSLSAMTSGIVSLGAASAVTAVSVGRLATAVGVGYVGAAMAAKQGSIVWGLAMKGVGKALTTVGKQHEEAMAKISKPAQAFVKTIEHLKVSYGEMQVLAQKGLFPGLEAGLKRALVLLPVIKQAVYDTAKVLGYLGDRLGTMISGHKSDIGKILERNVVTLRRMGDAAINFGSAFIGIWKGAGPVVGRMSRDVVTLSKHLDEFFNSKKGQRAVAVFFNDLRSSWEQYFHTAINLFKGVGNIIHDLLPASSRLDTSIARVTRQFREWTDTHGPQITQWFHNLMPDAHALGKLMGAIVVSLGKIAGTGQAQQNFKRIADGLRTGLLPILVQISQSFNQHVLPGIINVADALTHLIRDALPGLHILGGALGGLLTHVIAPLIKHLDSIVQYMGKFGSFGSVIGAALSVGGVLVGWQTLRREMQLVRTLGKQIVGTVPKGTVTRTDFIEAVPGLGARGVGGAASINAARAQSIERQAGGAASFYGGGGVLRGGGGRGPTVRRSNAALFASDSQVVGYTSASAIPYIVDANGRVRVNGKFAKLPQGTPYRSSTGRIMVDGPYTGGGIPATTVRGERRPSRIQQLSRQDRVFNSLYGDNTPLVGPTRIQRLRTGAAGVGESLRPLGGLAKGGLYGLLTALAFGVSPKSIGRDLTGNSQTFNLPKHSTVENLFGGALTKAENFVGGTPAEDKLYKFGDAAESTFKKLAATHNFKGLNQLANAARQMATDFPASSKALLNFARAVDKTASGVGDQFDQMKSASGFSMKYIKDTVSATTSTIKYRLGSDTEKGKEALATNFKIAVQDIKDSMNQGTIFTKDGLKEIKALMDQYLATFGIKGKAALNFQQGKDTLRGTPVSGAGYNPKAGHARGGIIPIGKAGTPGRDNVPMMLNGQPIIAAEGEAAAVFTRHQQSALGKMVSHFGYHGLGDFFSRNSKPNYMARGGMVTGDTDYLPALGHDLNAMANSTGTPIFVTSGRRTMAEQAALYAQYKGKRPVAFPSPNAPHVRGIAADIAPGRETFGGVAGRFGMGFTVPAESWHIQLLNAAAAGSSGAVKHIGNPSVSGLGNIGSIVGGGLRLAARAANAVIDQVAGQAFSGGDGSMPSVAPGAWQKVLFEIAKAKNWNAQDWLWIIAHESGGDPHAINKSSGATGLGQMLGANVAKYHGNGSPDQQVTGMGQYIEDRYGNPTNARRFWEAHNWYSMGGLIRAASGYPPIPSRGGGVPSVNPGDAVGNGSNDPNNPANKKKKRKGPAKPVYPSGARPSSTPYGASLLHGKGKKLPRINGRTVAAKKLANGKFDYADLGILRDPITGEDLGIQSINMLKPIERLVGSLTGIDNRFQLLQSAHGTTDEEQMVTLYDSAAFPDLTNYLKSHPAILGGLTPDAWKQQYGDSLDVPNSMLNGPPFGPSAGDGMTVQGIFTRGIGSHLDELMQEITLRTGTPPGFSGGKYQKVSGMLQTLLTIKGMRNAILPNGVAEGAIKERRTRLHKMKTMFDKNMAVRKAIKKKMTNIKSRGYGWQKAVHDNEDLIAKWRDYKRSGDHLPKPFRDSIDSNISRIEATNRELRYKKPKGGDGYTLGVLQREYDDTGRANAYMVGRDNASTWSLSGGRAQAISMSLDVWNAVKQYRQQLDSDTLSQIPTEQQVTIPTLQNEYNAWAGTRITPFNLGSGGSSTNLTDQMNGLLEQQNDLLRSQNAINGAYGNVFKGFSPLLAGRLVGSFDHGGVIPQTGYALVHRGEYIVPNPEGPFRTGMNAPQAIGGPTSITLILQGDGAALIDTVDARIDGRAANVTSKKVGRKSRLIGAAPGGR